VTHIDYEERAPFCEEGTLFLVSAPIRDKRTYDYDTSAEQANICFNSKI